MKSLRTNSYQYASRLLVCSLAFWIGAFSAHTWHPILPEEQSPLPTNPSLGTPIADSDSGPFKYGCKELELEKVWEELDVDAIRELKRREIAVWTLDPNFTERPSRAGYESQWSELQQKGFDCSIFGSIENEVDLNSDGQDELFVSGEVVSNRGDVETYVLKKIGARWTPIFFDKGSIEHEVLKTKSKKHLNLRFKTNWFGGGGRAISRYRFNGESYTPDRCDLEEHHAEIDGDMIRLDDTVKTRTTCNPLDNLLAP